MKISIITVTYNSEKTIKTTLNSVACQSWGDIEHIIIDGQSTDKTLSIIKNYPHITKVISEKDRGIYDAMNKGILNATGDVIGFLNSDDWFFDNSIIEKIVSEFLKSDIDAVYGDLMFVKNENCTQPKRIWRSNDYKPNIFSEGWVPPHPTFYARLSTYHKYGLFNSNLKFAADFDIMCRFIAIKNIKVKYLPGIKVKMRLGGATTSSLLNIIKGNIEIYKSLKFNKIRISPLIIPIKLYTKLIEIYKKNE